MHLVDDRVAEIPGLIELSIRVKDKTIRHKFAILPKLKSKVLIGVELWNKLNFILRPPPDIRIKDMPRCYTTGGLAEQTEDEKGKLEEFLKKELKQFEEIQGPTQKTEHYIRLKPDTPIKQRTDHVTQSCKP